VSISVEQAEIVLELCDITENTCRGRELGYHIFNNGQRLWYMVEKERNRKETSYIKEFKTIQSVKEGQDPEEAKKSKPSLLDKSTD
jgi:hypothetical protein